MASMLAWPSKEFWDADPGFQAIEWYSNRGMKVVGILQARMGSSRLMGKVLADLAGAPLLERCLQRAGRSQRLNELWVATTQEVCDEAVADLASRLSVRCHRGSTDDVLDRYWKTAQASGADVVVRLTGDNPMVDPEIIDLVVDALRPGMDYVCNRRPYTFPLGLDVEVFTIDALHRAWCEDKNPSWREHVTPYILRHTPPERLNSVKSSRDYSELRLTVDTAEDLALMRKVFEEFGHDHFGWKEAVDWLQTRPELSRMNQHIVQRTVE